MILNEIGNVSQGVNMLIIGMLVVFSVLLILFIVFNQLKRIDSLFTKKEKSPKNDNSSQTSSQELSGDVNAAISMAIYLYLNDQHDHESGLVTIKKSKKAYSPWNSKIYGMNNTLTR